MKKEAVSEIIMNVLRHNYGNARERELKELARKMQAHKPPEANKMLPLHRRCHYNRKQRYQSA